MAALLIAATGCQAVELTGTTAEVVERGSGRCPEVLSSILIRGFERTRQHTEVAPSVGFGVGASSDGGAGVGTSVGVSRRSYELLVDDRVAAVEALAARGLPGQIPLVRGAGGEQTLTLEGRLSIGYENKILNGAYRVFFTLVPAIFFGLPLHENGVVRLTASLYDGGGRLVQRSYIESRFSLWASIYSADEREEEARAAAIEAALDEMAADIREALDES